MRVGIVGLANAGKSTLFKALTGGQTEIAPFPFSTIDPHHHLVAIPDEYLDKLAELENIGKKTPAFIEFVDIAGLVRGSHKGEGLGNQFLAHIREVDTLIYTIRCFSNKDISHTEGSIDPARDIQLLDTELSLKDLETINKKLEELIKNRRGGPKLNDDLLLLLQKIKTGLNQEIPARYFLNKEELKEIKELNLLTSKPIILVLNIDENEMDKSRTIKENISHSLHYPIKQEFMLASPMKLEAEAKELNEQNTEFLQSLGIKSILNSIMLASFELLDLIKFYTLVGNSEVRGWTIKSGSLITGAAAKIHTDFKEKFIRAIVINAETLLQAGSWKNAKEKGLLRTEGKEYVVQNNDVIEIKI